MWLIELNIFDICLAFIEITKNQPLDIYKYICNIYNTDLFHLYVMIGYALLDGMISRIQVMKWILNKVNLEKP